MRRELGEARGVHLFDGGNALKNRLGVENVKIGVGGGAGDRVGRVRVSVKESACAVGPGKGIVDAFGRECSRERKKSAGKALGDAHKIRKNSGAVAGKHPPGAAKSGQNFVRDEQDIVRGGEAPDARKKLFRMNDHAARALQQRLDDDCGNLVAAFGEQTFEFSKTFDLAGRAREAHWTMRAIGRMNAQNWKAKRIESRGEWRIVAH
jgi:hypothetical protein